MRLVSLFLCTLLFFGCGKKEKSALDHWMNDNGKVKVLSTTAIVDDLVGRIGGEAIDHIALVNGQLDPHSYELVKGDDEKFNYAQIIFYNGLGLEHGASLQYRLMNHTNAVSLGDAILEKKPDSVVHVDGTKDPHIWMDISLWAESIDAIVKNLSDLDPDHAALFEQNGEAFRKSMLEKHEHILNLLQTVPQEKRFLVTSHDAFNYFTRSYLSNNEDNWEERFAAPEGLSPEGQLSTAHISDIINHLLFYQIHVVFPESNVSRDSLKKIVEACREKGLTVKISNESLYGDALGPNNSYLEMMEYNARVLIKEWQ